MSSNEVYNTIKVSDEIITSGQPTADQLRALAAEGLATVINLATHGLEDEAGLVRSLGMTYHHVPVEWGKPQESDFVAFEHIMLHRPCVSYRYAGN